MKKQGFLALIVGAAIGVSALLGGCSSSNSTSGNLQKVTVQLSWLPQSEFMGFYVAQQKGYYKDEGIDIKLLAGGSNIIPEQLVNTGVADFGVDFTSTLMTYQSKNWGLSEIAQLFQKPAVMFISKKSANINSLADLKGKKIGTWFGGYEYDLYALLAKAGLNKDKDVTLVQQDETMNQFTQGSIDVAEAMSYNEYGLLLEAGYKPSDLNVISAADENVGMLEDCLFGNNAWMKKNKDLTIKFLKATLKGWADASSDPDAAGETVYGVAKSVSLAHQKFMAEQVAQLVVPSGFDKTKIGYIDTSALQQTDDIAYKYGLLKKAVDVSKTANKTYWDSASSVLK